MANNNNFNFNEDGMEQLIKAETVSSRHRCKNGEMGVILCLGVHTLHLNKKEPVAANLALFPEAQYYINCRWTCSTKGCPGSAHTIRKTLNGQDYNPTHQRSKSLVYV